MSTDLSMFSAQLRRNENCLLAALPIDVRDRMRPHLELVALPLGKVLYESGDAIKWIFFPCDCIVSGVYTTEDGHSAEISLIGNDGIVGIPLVLGGDRMPTRVVVQSDGFACRMGAEPFKAELNHRDGELLKLLLRYVQALILQVAQTAVCNRHHDIGQQLARLILLALDRLPDNHLTMTQELMAELLGVRRESVTGAAKKLQQAGIIDYHRGRITVLGRAQLEHEACECYGVVRRETDRLFPPVLQVAAAR